MRRNESLLKGAFKDFRPLKEYFLKNRWHVTAGLISLLLVDLLQVLIPQVLKKAIDSLTFKTATSGILFKYGMMIMSIALAIALFRYTWRYLLFGYSRKVEEGLRNRLYDHLQTLSPSFFQRIKTGDLMARATNDINAVRMATGFGIFAVTDSGSGRDNDRMHAIYQPCSDPCFPYSSTHPDLFNKDPIPSDVHRI